MKGKIINLDDLYTIDDFIQDQVFEWQTAIARSEKVLDRIIEESKNQGKLWENCFLEQAKPFLKGLTPQEAI